MAWEVLAGQAQGGAYHYRQDITVTSVGHPLRDLLWAATLAALGGSTVLSMLAAGTGTNTSLPPRLVASSPDAISQAGQHCFVATQWQPPHQG